MTNNKSNNKSNEQLAKQFIDMWQAQTRAIISDPQFIHSIINIIEKDPELFWHEFANNNIDSEAWSDINEISKKCTPNTSTSNNGNDELAMVKRRLERCEARIQELESK